MIRRLVRSRARRSRKRPLAAPGPEQFGWVGNLAGGAEHPGTRKSLSCPPTGNGSVCSGRGVAGRLGTLPGFYGYGPQTAGGTETRDCSTLSEAASDLNAKRLPTR